MKHCIQITIKWYEIDNEIHEQTEYEQNIFIRSKNKNQLEKIVNYITKHYLK